MPVKKKLIPRFALSYFLFHRRRCQELIDLFYQSVSSVNSSVLKERFRNVVELQLPQKTLMMPCTYINASNDMFIQMSAIEDLKKVCPNIRIKEVKGGHFIIQANPKSCWKVVNEVLASAVD